MVNTKLFKLNIQEDIELFSRVVEGSKLIPGEKKDQIIKSVLFLYKYLSPKVEVKIFEWRGIPPHESVHIDIDPAYSELCVEIGKSDFIFDLSKASKLGEQIQNFNKSEGFDDVVKEMISNPKQIADTLFTLEIALICKKLFGANEFKFNQQYEINAHLKKPDIEFTCSLGKIIAECKRLHITGLNFYQHYSDLTSALEAKAKELNLFSKYRMEFKFIKSVSNTPKFISDFEKSIGSSEKVENKVYKNDGNEIWLLEKGEPVHFNEAYLIRNSLIALDGGIQSTELHKSNFICILAEELYSKLTTNLGKLINEAADQVPDNAVGLIFIDTPSTKALVDAWHRKDLKSHYKNILALGVYHKEGLSLEFRPEDIEKIERLRGK